MTMNVLIVDDEPSARRRLIRMLDRIDGVQVAGEAADGEEALQKIAALSPDVVLLDIHMPRLDGMTLAKTATDLPPIIFITAYNEHAVEAFEACAVDYLMKPVNAARLEQALAKVRRQQVDSEAVMSLLERMASQKPAREPGDACRVLVKQGDTVRMFDARGIARFYAADKYSAFVSDGHEYLLEESLNTLEQRLAPHDFVRLHRAELINLKQVAALRSDGGGGEVELKDGQTARVSRRHLPILKRALGIA